MNPKYQIGDKLKHVDGDELTVIEMAEPYKGEINYMCTGLLREDGTECKHPVMVREAVIKEKL